MVLRPPPEVVPHPRPRAIYSTPDQLRELGRSQDARAFVEGLRAQMTEALRTLNKGIPRNRKARILWRGKNRISLTPFEPLPAAPNLEAIKAELERRWPGR